MTAQRKNVSRGLLPRRFRRAFSLVEILVVIVILAIGSTVALYGYAGYREKLVSRTAANAIRQTLLFAKNRAISYRTPHQVVFDLDKNTFWVDQLDATGAIVKPKVAQEEGTGDFVDLHILKIDAAQYATATWAVRFDPDGTNPLVVVELHRIAEDTADLSSYTSVRLFPTSSDAQVVEGDRLL